VGTVTYPNGVTAQYQHDALNRVTSLAASSSAAEVGGYTYQRGPTGNLTSASELNGRNVSWLRRHLPADAIADHRRPDGAEQWHGGLRS